MGKMTITRDQRKCVLCRYWNGAIGSTTIQIVYGGKTFTFDPGERRFCFKTGRGMETNAVQECCHFMPRYDP